MRAVVLGSGSLVPTGRRNPAGYAVQADGQWLLIDGGSGTLRRLAEAGIDYRQLDHVCYTHIHPDHTGDLVPLLFAMRYTPGYVRQHPLRIFGPRGFATFFAKLHAVYGRWLGVDGEDFVVTELDAQLLALGRLEIEAVPMLHTVECVGYRVSHGDGAVAYTGDTDATDAVSELARGADVLIADCSAPDGEKMRGHMTPALVGELAERAGVPHVVLSHIYPHCEEHDLSAACRLHYRGTVRVAHDLLAADITAGEVRFHTLPAAVRPLGWPAVVSAGAEPVR